MRACSRRCKARGVDAHAFDPQDQGLPELDRGRFDRAFIVLHGRFGEDGTIQGVLEWLGIPYTGSGVLASALAMDKWRTKLLWQASGIPTPKWVRLDAASDFAAVVQTLGLPIMVKPAREGSSIGMSKVTRVEDLAHAYEHAAQYDEVIIGEQFIEGTELTAGVLGTTPLPLIRLETPRMFYDYEAKYLVDSTRYILPSGLPQEQEVDLQATGAEGLRGARLPRLRARRPDAGPCRQPVLPRSQHDPGHDRSHARADGCARRGLQLRGPGAGDSGAGALMNPLQHIRGDGDSCGITRGS